MPTILFVEDDRLTRESIGGRLSRRGLAVVAAQSGEEALEIAAGHPNLAAALLDFELPGIDGEETLRRLRQADPQLPVVFCSAHMDSGIREKLLGMGIPAQCLLAKPCRFQQVLDAVTMAMRKPGTDECCCIE
jgi:two-component system, OmpR family, response regulator